MFVVSSHPQNFRRLRVMIHALNDNNKDARERRSERRKRRRVVMGDESRKFLTAQAQEQRTGKEEHEKREHVTGMSAESSFMTKSSWKYFQCLAIWQNDWQVPAGLFWFHFSLPPTRNEFKSLPRYREIWILIQFYIQRNEKVSPSDEESSALLMSLPAINQSFHLKSYYSAWESPTANHWKSRPQSVGHNKQATTNRKSSFLVFTEPKNKTFAFRPFFLPSWVSAKAACRRWFFLLVPFSSSFRSPH